MLAAAIRRSQNGKMGALIELNPRIEPASLAAQFQRSGRIQIRDVLTDVSARSVQSVLSRSTPWGLAWQSGSSSPPQLIRSDSLAALSGREREEIAKRASADADYGFAYLSYPLVTAYLEGWDRGGPHEQLLEELNGATMLNFVRTVTGIPEIAKMDGQATLYGPGHFLRPHNDEEIQRGRRVAYVLNLTACDWQPEWGGYLNFFDEDRNIEQGFLPRFNCLNLFQVPQWHNVGEVTAAAPLARYSITGWARDC